MIESFLPGLSSAPNVHPMFVHFPVALWPAALLLWANSPGHDLVHAHKYVMIPAVVLGLAASVLAWATRKRSEARWRWTTGGLLLTTVVVTTLGADRGAMLVFRHGIGTNRLPPPAAPHGTPAHDHGGHEHGH